MVMAAIIRPVVKNNTTDPSHTTFKWGKIIIDHCLSHGVDVLDIIDPWADYDNITYLLTKHRPELIIYTGHGCQNYLATDNGCSFTNGNSENVCNDRCRKPANLRLLKNTIVITYSCHSAGDPGIGNCAIRYGARAYVGFTDYLMFTSDRQQSEDLFKDALLPMAIEVINGKTVGEAVTITKNALLKGAKEWKPVKYLSIPMMWNHEYIQVLGNINAAINTSTSTKSGG